MGLLTWKRVWGVRIGIGLIVLGGLCVLIQQRVRVRGVFAQDSPVAETVYDAPSPIRTHRLTDLNWTEVRELVPAEIDAVLIAIGSLEAHGVINNGADTLVPSRLAELLAPRVNALIAPAIPYSVTSEFGLYPGSLQISEKAFSAYVGEVLIALAEEGFENIILLNGHPPNRTILDGLAAKVSAELKVRTLVLDWWTCCEDVTLQVYDAKGGHGGVDETALVLALDPDLVREDLYYDGMAMATARGWTAHPLPSPIVVGDLLDGKPDFDPGRSRIYLNGVVDKLSSTIGSVLGSWNHSGL